MSIDNVTSFVYAVDPNSTVQKMDKPSLASLTEVFRHQLIVRVMSARNHDFGNAAMNSFYHQNASVIFNLVI